MSGSTPEVATTFDSLGLSAPILSAIKSEGYSVPSPIQAQAIPAVLENRDVMAAAQTGTGKTAGFTLPLLELLSQGSKAKPKQVRALILTPTRELAAQVYESVKTYGSDLPLTSAVVFGGVKINPQIATMRRGTDILVATPGRLLDLHQQKAVKFDKLEIFVLDEADRMLDMGFIHDIRKILAVLPKVRQNLMFSATFSDEIRKLAKGLVYKPVEISVSPRNTTAESIEQIVYPVDKNQKSAALAHLIKTNKWSQVLVFTRTKHGANRLTKFLEKQKITAAAIHGNKSQGARTKALTGFKQGGVRVLVATDIAARGIDIDQLPQVVNFELPNIPEDYVHRIGRTGRASASGQASSLVCADEFPELCDIERLIKTIIPRLELEEFPAVHELPESDLNKRPKKISKQKKKQPRNKPEHRDGQKSGDNARGNKPRANSRRRSSARNKTGRKPKTSEGAQKPSTDKPQGAQKKAPTKRTRPNNARRKPSTQPKRNVRDSRSS